MTPVNKVAEGRPHIVDMIKNGEIALIVNTVEDRRAGDPRLATQIRRAALQATGFRSYTTLAGARAGCTGMEQARSCGLSACRALHGAI